MRYASKKQRGSIILLALVFSAVFFIVVQSLLGFVFVQKQAGQVKQYREQAVQIAEAGLDYYKWFLAHYPDDLTNGTGNAGPYEHDYADPEGGVVGTFSLEVDGNEQCDVVGSIEITSTGWAAADPSYKRTVWGRYARPSVAEYAYILNSNVWAGADRVITGPYHSNGGIRMDGASNSTVSSAVSDWLCTSSFGCSPSQTQPGVFGDGSDSALWEFPVPNIDFAGITVDLANMKDLAQSSGLYFGPAGGQSNRHGYRLVFKQDGTVDVYKVKDTDYVLSQHIDDWGEWIRDYHIIEDEDFEGNFALPDDCRLIFVADNVWVEGTVKNKITVAAASIQQQNFDPDIVLHDDLTYTTTDGSDGVTLIAENSVLVPLNSPDDMQIRGIFIAQNGYFGRNYYSESDYPANAKRNSLTVIGSIVSDGRVGTKWSCGGNYCSGYETRVNAYDRRLATEPPPLTPYVSTDYRFVEWREER